MKAVAVYPGKADSVHLRDVAKPEINENEVLVRTAYAGVCGTDMEINQGLYGTAPSGDDYLILGHECVGVVEEVGSRVQSLQKGEYVVRTVRRPCKGCMNCDSGANDMCSTGDFIESGIKGLHGVMAEYFKDMPCYLVKVPDDYSKIAVLLEPLSVVEKATRQAFEIQERLFWEPKKALVTGAGPIGMLEAMILRSKNIDTYVVARSPKGNLKSRLVEETGAEYISTVGTSLREIAKRIGNIDLIVEASGSSDIAFKSMEVLGINGVLCLTSITGGSKSKIVPCDKINLDFVLGNRCVFGTVNANMEDYLSGVKRFSVFEGRWPGLTGKLITREVPVDGFKAGFAKLPEDIKNVIGFR